MATVGTSTITLVDYKKTLDPDSKVARIIEILDQENGLAMDMQWQEGNLDVGHRHTIRSGLPSATWRLLNYGVQPTKGRTVQVDDMCGILEAVCDIDKKICELNGNKAAYRWSQDVAHIQGMNNDLESALWYGNQTTDPEKITGLAPRYATGDTAKDSGTSADNVLNGGGTGSDNLSVWLVCHSPQVFFGIYPKGMKAGIQHEDRGIQDKTDSGGLIHRVYRSFYSWDCGVALADWEGCVRIANVDVSSLIADGGTVSAGANLITLMIQAMHRIPPRLRNKGRLVFYGNENVETYLDLQTLKQTNMHVTYSDGPHGLPIMKFRGIPFRRSDALLNTESKVVFS
jgi:hypothetical protein